MEDERWMRKRLVLSRIVASRPGLPTVHDWKYRGDAAGLHSPQLSHHHHTSHSHAHVHADIRNPHQMCTDYMRLTSLKPLKKNLPSRNTQYLTYKHVHAVNTRTIYIGFFAIPRRAMLDGNPIVLTRVEVRCRNSTRATHVDPPALPVSPRLRTGLPACPSHGPTFITTAVTCPSR
eukprot:GHVU01050164.1.p1 GENE.GHVU01050164.1~~GHVU01050164.1.p1  ORF type:complete len:186 (-),score=0.20 GHVU01050164.1:387-914(-)